MSIASTAETNQIEFHIFVGNQPFMRDRLVAYFEALTEHEDTVVSGWQNETVKSTLNIKSTNNARIQEIVNDLINPDYIQRQEDDDDYVYGNGEDMDTTISTWVDTVIEEKERQLNRELNARQKEIFYNDWHTSHEYEALQPDIITAIFEQRNFSVSIIETTVYDWDVTSYRLGFNILFNKEEVMEVYNAWYPENRWYHLLIDRFDIEVTWKFNEDQETVQANEQMYDDEPSYQHMNWVTFKVPNGVSNGPFDYMVDDNGDYDTYNMPLTGNHTDKIEFIQPGDFGEPMDTGPDTNEYNMYNVYFYYRINKTMVNEDSDSSDSSDSSDDESSYMISYSTIVWNEMITTMKHHTAKCMAQFCSRNLNPVNARGRLMYVADGAFGYGWKPTEEAMDMLYGDENVWRQWFDSGVQPQRFEVETIPDEDEDSSDEEEDEEDAPIPAFFDRLVEEQDNMLGLGQNIKYENFLNLGDFNITVKLIYDNYLADVRDVGCPSDGKSNLEYPIRTGPSQSQIYCMADFIKWISTPNYNGDENPLNKLDPGTNQPLREMTIHIMDRGEIEEQEWKDIQIARTTLEVDMKNLNLKEGAKIKERKESLRKNTTFTNELKNRLAMKFREQEQKLKMDIRAIEEKIKHLPKTKRLLTLAKIERNSVARIFAKLKF